MKVNIQSSLEEAIDLLEGYVDVKDSESGPVANDAMRAVQLLEEILDELRRYRIGGPISQSHRFSNRKEVRQQFVPGLKPSESIDEAKERADFQRKVNK